MTIAAAALCQFGTTSASPDVPHSHDAVVVIADRMMTVGDTEYQGGKSKIYLLSKSGYYHDSYAVCLSAGEINIAAMVIEETRQMMSNEEQYDIATLAKLYADNYSELRRRYAERAILSPYGLAESSFISFQNTMNADFVRERAADLHNYYLGFDSIIAGVDATGPHIYFVGHPGREECRDHSAFLGIGSGARHFESLFMSATPPFSYLWSLNRALFLAYTAKKKAEIAPGVGRETDILICTINGVIPVRESVYSGLQVHYDEYTRAERNAFNAQADAVNIHISVNQDASS